MNTITELRRFAEFTELTPDLIFFVKRQNREYLLGNSALARVVGAKRFNDIAGKKTSDFYDENIVARYDELDKIVGRGDTLVERLDFSSSNNGKPSWYLYSRKAVEVAGEKVFLGVSRRLNNFAGSNRIYGRLAKATDLITKRLSEKIDIEEVASHSGCSSSQLERDFARVFHLSPKNYQTRLRIQIAKDRLRQDVPLFDIATECGFIDQSGLSRAFKMNTGITPSRYRTENALV